MEKPLETEWMPCNLLEAGNDCVNCGTSTLWGITPPWDEKRKTQASAWCDSRVYHIELSKRKKKSPETLGMYVYLYIYPHGGFI